MGLIILSYCTVEDVLKLTKTKPKQFGFKDHTEILLYNDTVTYKDKKGEYNVFTNDNTLNITNFDRLKELKYAQNIMTKMIKFL